MTAASGLTLNEEWRDVEGFPGYEVSNMGRVRSWKPRGGKGRGKTPTEPRLISLRVSDRGYIRVGMRNADGEQKTVAVHRMVAKAFVAGRENGPLVCHNDSNPVNNVASNLRWDTVTGNAIDCSKLGGIPRQVLNEAQVREIRELYAAGGHTNRSLAAKFGVTHQAIRDILRRKNYRWVA